MDSERQTFVLVSDLVRHNALAALTKAPDFTTVTIAARTRSNEQNAKLHAMLTDLSRSQMTWAGKRRTLDEWKMLIVSGHSVATGGGGEVIPGLESEFVAIRESTATMGVKRMASLIEYLQAFCDTNGVELNETRRRGYAGERDAA